MKNPGKDRRHYRRVIAIFLFAIMLPSLIQAYLGLRYLKQEEQRQEQLVLRSLRVTLADAARQMEEDIHDSLVEVFDSLYTAASASDPFSAESVHQFIADNQVLNNVFILDIKGNLLYPRTFRENLRQSGSGLNLPERARTLLVKGEESEARGEYEGAIRNYETGLNMTATTQSRLMFLVRIARCQLKNNAIREAIDTYQQVIREDSHYFYGEEIPFQVIASFQLARIYDRTGKPGEATGTLIRLYEQMLSNFNRFPAKQYYFYSDKVKNDLKTRLQQEGQDGTERFEHLVNLENAFLKEPVSREAIQETIIPSIEIALLSRSPSEALRIATAESSSDSSILVAFKDLGLQHPGFRVLGGTINQDRIWSQAREALKHVDMGENLAVFLLAPGAKLNQPTAMNIAAIAEEPLPLLDGNIKDRKLVLAGLNGTTIREFTSKGTAFYYGIIVVIIVVIALGVFFIFNDISREQELMRMKTEFISNVTHEIKTPIATIRSLAENVNEGWVSAGDKQLDYFRLIGRESERLGHLVENTLDFSRIEAGNKRYIMEETPLKELIEKTVDRFKVLSADQGVSIHCALPDRLPLIRVDRMAMGQAILNLLDNAAKYSPDEKSIILDVRAGKEEVTIGVTDKGMGIDKKEIPRIFDKFYRSDAGQARKVAGSGIGLTLVKEIVESHGGRIRVESEKDRGSTFTIVIPLNQT